RTALRIEPRARMALAVALTEWIVWRFDGLHGRTQPAAFLEAAWCATADPRYLRFFEVPREDWQGPVEGPLWCAITHLRHALAVGVDFPRDLRAADTRAAAGLADAGARSPGDGVPRLAR